MSSMRQVWALPVALVTIANISATWFKLVSEQAPKPYLVSIPSRKSRAEF
jgi:alpha-1,2-glucosyltransferase